MSEPTDALLEAYAKLVVRVGVNVQFGQRVVIRGAVEHAAAARAIATEAYRVGASHVTVQYDDALVLRAQVDHAEPGTLGRVLPHEVEGVRAWREDRPAVIRLTGNPNPGVMDGADPARIAEAMPLELMREVMPIMSANLVSWTVVGAPNAGWARTVLGEPDVERLWQAVAVAMRLDQDDPVQAWRDHVAALTARREILNARTFDKVRYRGPGTDLTVGLVPGARWMGGSVQNADGVEFVPNMPTEEVFVSPDWRRADGVAATTAPFFLPGAGVLVEGLRLELADGQVRQASADRGEESVRTQFDRVPRARHLGEVAIVDRDSAVRRTGLTYADMLYDENIGSHIAWGSGFAMVLDRGAQMSADELVQTGVNQASTHVDVVVGSPEVEIDGIHADGTAVPITRGDTFVLD